MTLKSKWVRRVFYPDIAGDKDLIIDSCFEEDSEIVFMRKEIIRKCKLAIRQVMLRNEMGISTRELKELDEAFEGVIK